MSSMDEQIRRIEGGNAFTAYNHMELCSVEEGKAVFQLTIRPESKNPFGIVHGGALYGLADNAAGYAAHSDGRVHVTQGGSMHFLGNQKEGTVYATGTVRHRGRTTCLVSVDITGDNGKLLATGEFVYFCVSEKRSEEKNK